MKKILFTILYGIILSGKIFAADSLEFRPSPYAMSERMLFSPTVEGGEGLRINPAVLGLGHGTNGRFSLLTMGPNFFNTWDNIRELDFTWQLSGLGLGWRYFSDPFTNKSFHQWTAGLGFGDRSFSFGLTRDFFAGDLSQSASWNIGFLSRPVDWLSLSYALRNINQPSFVNPDNSLQNFNHEQTTVFGLGLRPFLGKEYLTIGADYYVPKSTPYGKGMIRLGANAKFIEGLTLTGAFQKNFSNAIESRLPFRNSFSVGINFEYGHSTSEFAGIFDSQGNPSALILSNKFSDEKFDFFELFGGAPKSIAELRIGELRERPETSFFGMSGPSVHSIINALDKASEDNQIGGILLWIAPISSGGFTELTGLTQELGDALKRAKDAGKRIVAYLPQGGGVPEMYLASYAETIVMPKEATLNSIGENMSLLRMRKFFEKYGIDWEVEAAGDYKTTFQTMFTDSATGVQAREINEILQNQYSQTISRIEQARNIRLTDEQRNMLSGLVGGDRAVEMKLVDFTGFYDRARKEIAQKVLGINEDVYFSPSLLGIKRWNGRWGTPPKIAVVPVEGSITTGESSGGSNMPFFGSAPSTGSETFVRQMKSASKRNDIKAIIVRVNSGGGSALGSDQMHDAIMKASEEKPVIISFGDVAASGGYYLAVAGKKIFANQATITGSIGVITAKPVVARLLDTLQINEETYKVGEHTDMFSLYRKFTPEERKMVEEYVNSTYQEFLRKVAKGRKMEVSQVESLAGGRVYTGQQAEDRKLVDQFGGLYDAVREAQKEAELDDDYQVEFYYSGGNFSFEDLFMEAAMNEFLSRIGLKEDFSSMQYELK